MVKEKVVVKEVVKEVNTMDLATVEKNLLEENER